MVSFKVSIVFFEIERQVSIFLSRNHKTPIIAVEILTDCWLILLIWVLLMCFIVDFP